MITTGFDARVKIQQIIENQLPEFILSENPKASDFLKQYYISQEFQGGPIDIAENLDQYINLNNLTPEVVSGITTLSVGITSTTDTIFVNSTKGFPNQYGLLRIGDEIITYTGISTTSFTGCVRGFSGIVTYHSTLNPEELAFSTSKAEAHSAAAPVQNLSVLFLKEFYKKIKVLLAPGFENVEFVSDLNVNSFIKNIKSFYQSKGTEESFKILYKVLYGIEPKVINLEDFLIKPSTSEFIRREVLVTELVSSGDPNNLVGQVVKNLTDTASGPVSEVEIIRRNNKTFYKIQLFAGFNDKSLIEGNFEITPKSEIVDNVSIGASTISVDSTIGFPSSGKLICRNVSISYTDKSINQFFGCSGITTALSTNDIIRSDQIIYGYENGDTNKKVELRITGVLSELENQDDIYFSSPKDTISVKQIGDIVENPSTDKSFKQFIFNSWIYNTSSRYEISSFSGGQITLYENPDKSSLKVGDNVNILGRNSENIVVSDAVVTSIVNNIVTINKTIGVPSTTLLSVRRNLNYASSLSVPLKYDRLTSDIQNTYNENDEYIYAASNSLPSYQIKKNIVSSSLNITPSSNLTNIFSGYSPSSDRYSILSFDSDVSFITGDEIFYTGTGEEIPGLTFNQRYYVEVLTQKNKIRLYNARSFIPAQSYIEFNRLSTTSTHTFTLAQEKGDKKIAPKKILRKLSLNPNTQSGIGQTTEPGPVGMLINGVEILNYKSTDSIYCGPIQSIRIYNQGIDYDVINPPTISFSSPTVGVGTTALATAVVRGSLKEVLVDPNEVDIERVLSVSLSGGNGSGARLQAVTQKQYREIEFNAQSSIVGGGVDVVNETITFLTNHNLQQGTPVVYNNNGNASLGIGSFEGSNTYQGTYLVNGSVYYPDIINTKAIKIYNTQSDLNSGINTVGFTTENAGGIHKFRLFDGKNVLSEIKVLDGGSGYENRTLKVNPSGISTSLSIVTFNGHGFNNGDLIKYNTDGTPVSGLSTSNNYYVIKIDDSKFRLADAGVAGIAKTNFNRGKFVKFESTGSGYQVFSYPEIQLNINVEYSGFIGTITATPVVRGKIVDAFLYENGTNYGSNVLNFHRKPVVTVRNGTGAQLKPIVRRGKVVSVEVQNGGLYYTSSPDLIVNGEGLGAKLRAVVVNGRITNVIVVNSGSNYVQNTTSIKVEPAGKNAVIDADVRSLTINNQVRFGDEIFSQLDTNLSYGVVGYSTDREGVAFSDPDPDTKHSKVIGWCYDGNPIYGPYGYSDASDNNSEITKLKSSYTSSLTNVDNRPSDFPLGFFVEDYKYTASGSLDENNGRFAKTPEFPNGIYAYYVGVTTDGTTGKLKSEFPYFVGNKFRSNLVSDLNQDQSFNFNSSKLIRNTFPYRLNKKYSGNDFIVESNESFKQVSQIESVSSGSVDDLIVVNAGSGYKVGELVIFNNDDTNGGGASAEIESLTGKQVAKLETSSVTYENTVVTRKNENEIEVTIKPYHVFENGDKIQISGISTSIDGLANFHTIGVTSESSSLIYDVPSAPSVGFVTDIYVSPIPLSVSVGSTAGIGTEIVSILNVFKEENVLRVVRSLTGLAHTATETIRFQPTSFTVPLGVQYFDSRVNDKVYLNPTKSIGVNTTTGTETSLSYTLGQEQKTVSVQAQSIYLPDHPFKTNQRVLFKKPSSSSALLVRNTPGGSNISLPISGDSQYVYIINKSKDFIGIVTEVGLTTSTNGLYFSSNGSDDYTYSFESEFNQVTANVKKVNTLVTLTTSHGLTYGDQISLSVKPNLNVGVANTSSIIVKYNSTYESLLLNPVGFNSTGISTTNNTINIQSHKFKSGDKVFYNASDLVSSGLTTGPYYVYRVDDNYIKLSETYSDSISSPPIIVSIASTGGKGQELSLVNPQIVVTKNNNLVFNLSDNSLVGYKFKIFYDKDQKSEFVSTGNTTTFLTPQLNTIGISSDANLKINYNENLPTKLYYNIEKNGTLANRNSEVSNYSEILYTDSLYDGNYNVFGVGSTTFSISLKDVPEKSSYQSTDCYELKYTTTSKTASGGVNSLDIVSGGFNYEKLPRVVGISTLSSGVDAIIKPDSNTIGQISQLRILNEGFEYASDKTLKPKADIPTLIRLENSEKITNVKILDGGKNFISEPNLILVNTYTNTKVSSGLLKPKIRGTSIISVDVVEEPKGLQAVSHRIFTTNNSNGVQVIRIISYTNGIVECEISTPAVDGFLTPPFTVGDKVFVEGLQKQSFTNDLGVTTYPGTGFNSSDNGYKFFTVTEFINTIPAILKFNIGEYTDNAGTPVEVQTSFNSIVNSKNYPLFELTRIPSLFFEGEKLQVNDQASDLVVQTTNRNYIKVLGDYAVKVGDSLTGATSGNMARINDVLRSTGEFGVNYSNKKNYGWKDDIGKLNDNLQVIPDNDYYQNLSYTIKTTGEKYKDNKVIGFDKVKDSVNRLVHPTGFKNFADVGITSSAKVGIKSDQALNQILEFVSERRVDTYNNFDLVLDYDPTADSSRFIIFKNKRLADYIECRSNRVLQIDDISNRFSSKEFNRDEFVELIDYSITDNYSKFLVQISDENKLSTQISELIVLNNYENTYTLNKSDLYTDNLLGTLSGEFASSGDPTLRFDPINPYEFNYDIKVYRESFSSSPFNIGVGYTDLGFVRLNARTEHLPAYTGIATAGITTDVFRSQVSAFNSIYSNVLVINDTTLDMNFFEVLGHYDGENGYVSEYYFDTDNLLGGVSFGYIGTFGITVSDGVFKLNFTNNTENPVTIKAKTVGIGSTTVGVGTYRYLVDGQIPGSERTARIESAYKVATGVTTFISYDSAIESATKSLIKVGVGSTASLHQILVVSDQTRVNIQQYPFLAVGAAATTGIGTFTATMSGTTVNVKFHPDPMFASDSVVIQSYNNFLYFDTDLFNIPGELTYGTGIEEFQTSFYGALNTFGKDKLDFDLNYNRTPIFQKTFNPSNTTILDKSTGIFTIENHFFQTGEELIYTPDSTLPGIAATAVGIGSTLVGGATFVGDFIVGFSTITGIGNSFGITTGSIITGESIPTASTIVSIGRTFTYFVGDVSIGSSVITGIANTSVLTVGSGIFSGNNTSIGTIVSVGVNSITASTTIDAASNRVYYSSGLTTSITISNVSTGTTFRKSYITGITTNVCPSKVYAIRVDNNKFKITGTSGGSGVGFTFTSSGSGNVHKLEMKKKLEKTLITVNGVTQYPISYTPLNYRLRYNGGSIGAGVTYIALSGISSISPKDLLKIDNEFISVNNVGLGTTSTGPITGIGTIPIIQVYRGYVGSSATTHTDETEVRVYRGSYNIVGNKIWFTEAPDGKGNNDRLDGSSLPLPKSTFNGRVFLRRDYTNNKIYDDISNSFNGIGRTFAVTKEGQNTTGVEAGSGLVFINDIFQTPDTTNNTGNNYTFAESSGITTVTFTGVKRPNTDQIITVPYDINQNQIPRGGVIISLASTGGLGYAPLVGASVTAVIGAGGSITSIGIGSTGSFGSGYRGNVAIGVSDSTGTGATITAVVGAGGSLVFTVTNGGSGYTNPRFDIDSPSYEDLSIVGVSRLSIGSTTSCGIGLSMTINVGESSVVGIGTSFFEVKSFKLSKPGYAFAVGDVFKVVGLVTDARLSSPIEELKFTVLETFSDTFASWQFGELDFIDSIKNLQNGIRTRFPLYRNNQLLSFQVNRSSTESSLIDFNPVLLIYVNGVMQEPGVSYQFDGGTTFKFTEAPKESDDISIFFYRGTRNVDSLLINVNETVKVGDTIQIDKNNDIPSTIGQSERIISLIESADLVETGIYLGDGIDKDNYKPLNWSKQKRDLFINENIEYKSRDSIESMVFPTARVIKDFSTSDTEIFLDSAQFFNYEENVSDINIQDFSAILLQNTDPVSAAITAVVGSSSTVTSLVISDGGSGYNPGSTVTLKIASPVGIGTTATATATVSIAGTISSINITNSGYGYTVSNPPIVLTPLPEITSELITGIRFVEGFAGIVTGITTTSGTGSHPLAIKFNVKFNSTDDLTTLLQGYPIVIYDTVVGQGVTSVNNSDSSIVGIGTTFADNVYFVSAISRNNLVGIITCNVLSTTNVSGINTNGDYCGRFSWGRLAGFSRQASTAVGLAVSGYTVTSGLSTFPQLQRRGYGLRDGGALRKQLE